MPVAKGLTKRVANGRRSTKTVFTSAQEAFLAEVGAERDNDQTTKTRWALDFHAAKLGEMPPRATERKSAAKPGRPQSAVLRRWWLISVALRHRCHRPGRPRARADSPGSPRARRRR
jgi:hypothetical protein